MKQFQIRGGAQAHFDLFILRHNFRKFPRGKRKGISFAQLEELDVPIDDWLEVIFPEGVTIKQVEVILLFLPFSYI